MPEDESLRRVVGEEVLIDLPDAVLKFPRMMLPVSEALPVNELRWWRQVYAHLNGGRPDQGRAYPCVPCPKHVLGDGFSSMLNRYNTEQD